MTDDNGFAGQWLDELEELDAAIERQTGFHPADPRGDSEPSDEEVTRRGPYIPDGRGENDRTL